MYIEIQIYRETEKERESHILAHTQLYKHKLITLPSSSASSSFPIIFSPLLIHLFVASHAGRRLLSSNTCGHMTVQSKYAQICLWQIQILYVCKKVEIAEEWVTPDGCV